MCSFVVTGLDCFHYQKSHLWGLLLNQINLSSSKCLYLLHLYILTYAFQYNIRGRIILISKSEFYGLRIPVYQTWFTVGTHTIDLVVNTESGLQRELDGPSRAPEACTGSQWLLRPSHRWGRQGHSFYYVNGALRSMFSPPHTQKPQNEFIGFERF